MNNKATQALNAWTTAQTAANNASIAFYSYVQPYEGRSGLQNLVNSDQEAVNQDQCILDEAEGTVASCLVATGCVHAVGSPGCGGSGTGTGGSQQANAIIKAYAALVAAETALSTAQGELTHAQGLWSTYQNALKEEESLWKKWQDAQAAGTAAGNALSLAQATYDQAVTIANGLIAAARKAATEASDAKGRYQKLKEEYDKQQAAKKKPKQNPPAARTAGFPAHCPHRDNP